MRCGAFVLRVNPFVRMEIVVAALGHCGGWVVGLDASAEDDVVLRADVVVAC